MTATPLRDAVAGSKIAFGGTAIWEETVEPNAGPNVKVTRETMTVSRYFRVPVTQANAFLDACMPLGKPAEHPTWRGLFVETADFSPFGGAGSTFSTYTEGTLEPDFYLASLTYSPWNSAQSSPTDADTLAGSVNVSTEIMTSEGDGYKWDSAGGDAVKEKIPVAKIIPIIDREIKLTRLNAIPWTAIRACVGRVNSGTYQGASAETMLYLGAAISFKFSFTNSREPMFDVSHKFKERRVETTTGTVGGWNHYYCKETKVWRKLYPLPYPTSGSFSTIIPGLS